MSLQILDWSASSVPLPYFEGSVPAGFPSPAEDHMEGSLDIAELLIRNKTATFLMRVDGDSMRDAGIHDGALLVVDRSLEPVSGSVVVAAVDGAYTCKRLRRASDCIWLEPANPCFRPLRVSDEEQLHIFGVVRHAIHTIR